MNEDEVKSGVDSTAKQSVLVTSPLTMKTRVQCVVTTGEGKSYSSKIGQCRKNFCQIGDLSTVGRGTLLKSFSF